MEEGGILWSQFESLSTTTNSSRMPSTRPLEYLTLFLCDHPLQYRAGVPRGNGSPHQHLPVHKWSPRLRSVQARHSVLSWLLMTLMMFRMMFRYFQVKLGGGRLPQVQMRHHRESNRHGTISQASFKDNVDHHNFAAKMSET